jgi:hypothetical protein
VIKMITYIGRRQCQGWKRHVRVCVCFFCKCGCVKNYFKRNGANSRLWEFHELREEEFCSARKESGAQLLPDMVGTFVDDNWFGTQVKMLLKRNCKLFGTTLVFFPFNEISLRLNKVFPNSFFQMRKECRKLMHVIKSFGTFFKIELKSV